MHGISRGGTPWGGGKPRRYLCRKTACFEGGFAPDDLADLARAAPTKTGTTPVVGQRNELGSSGGSE